MTAEMETLERRQFAFTIREPRNRLAKVRQIRPCMAGRAPAGISDAADRLAWFHHALREPRVHRVTAEEIASAHDQRTHAASRRCFQMLLECDTDLALARQRTLRIVLAQHGERV